MDKKINSQVNSQSPSPIAGNFSDRDPVVEKGVQFNQGDIEDHLSPEYLRHPWDQRDKEWSEVIDSEGHRVRINHY